MPYELSPSGMPNPNVHLPGVNQELRQAALVFLQRYQAQHAGNDQVLFCKAVEYLSSTFELATPLAEKPVSYAYGDLKILHERRPLDIGASSDILAVIEPAHQASYLVCHPRSKPRLLKSAVTPSRQAISHSAQETCWFG